MLDFLLFGGTLLNLVAEEVKYILNLNNWRKGLNTFRNEFIIIRDHLKQPVRLSKTLMFGNPNRKGLVHCGNKRSGF